MFNLLAIWFCSSLGLYLTSLLVPQFTFSSFKTAMMGALIIGFLNMFIKPILLFLTIPINILTLGLFTFVINAIILKMGAYFIEGFKINGWIPALIGAVVLMFIQSFLNQIILVE